MIIIRILWKSPSYTLVIFRFLNSWLKGVSLISLNAESMSVKQHPGICAFKKNAGNV